MHTIDIPDRKEVYTMAEQMHELNERQYITLCYVLNGIESGNISQERAALMLTLSFASIRFSLRYWLMSKKAKELVHANLMQISKLTESVFERRTTANGETMLVPSIAFTDNKIKRFGRLSGPDDALTNCSFFEYKQAFGAWLQYQETQDVAHLDEMIAILYRPRVSFAWIKMRMKNFGGDSREKFTVKSNPLRLQARVKRVQKWPAHVKYGIWLWFTACMDFLRVGKPVIDGQEIDLSILYKGDDGNSAGIGLTGVLYSLAETGVFGDIEETGNANLYDVLARLYQVKLQTDNLKQKKERAGE